MKCILVLVLGVWGAGALAATVGPFCGVSVDNITDTPCLKRDAVVYAEGRKLLDIGKGMAPDPDDPQAMCITSRDFEIRLDSELSPGSYSVAVEVVAPNRGTDSFWVELDGERLKQPFTLPTGKMARCRFAFRVERSGPKRVRLVLREAPGARVRGVALERTVYVCPQEPMIAERAHARPRIFFTAGELAGLRSRVGSPAGKRYYKPTSRLRTAPAYSPRRRTCGKFRGMADTALVHMARPTPERLQKQIEWIRAALTYEHWGHGYASDVDLDAQYMMEGLALTYDWLHEQLPADLRKQLRDCIAEHCRILYEASLGGRTGGGMAFQQNHFWFAHLALGLGAAAVYGEVPEARIWLGWTFDRFERVFLTLGDDGGFHEQPAYWDYSMPTLFMMIDLYEQCSGSTIPYGDLGLRNAAAYRFHNMYPGLKRTAAFGDTTIKAGVPRRDALLWLAKRYQDPVARGMADLFTSARAASWPYLVYLDESLAATDPRAVVPTMHYYDDIQMAFARTSWSDDATMFGFISRPLGGEKWAALCRKFGLGGTGHNHPAQNHFVLFARGEVLAADPGYTYEKRTANHNTVLVDGRGQLGDGEMWPHPTAGRAHITAFTSDRDVCLVTGEAASSYPKDLGLTRFERTLAMVGPDIVVVYDRLQAKDERRFTWRLHFYGHAARVGPAWVATVGQAQMGIVPLLPAGCDARVRRETPVYVHPSRNLTPKVPHIDLVEFESVAGRGATFLVPLLIGRPGDALPQATMVRGEGYDAVRVGETFVAFRRVPGDMAVELPTGRTLRTKALAVVCDSRSGRGEVVEHGR